MRLLNALLEAASGVLLGVFGALGILILGHEWWIGSLQADVTALAARYRDLRIEADDYLLSPVARTPGGSTLGPANEVPVGEERRDPN